MPLQGVVQPELVRERNRGGEVAQPDVPVGVDAELPQHTEDALARAAGKGRVYI